MIARDQATSARLENGNVIYNRPLFPCEIIIASTSLIIARGSAGRTERAAKRAGGGGGERVANNIDSLTSNNLLRGECIAVFYSDQRGSLPRATSRTFILHVFLSFHLFPSFLPFIRTSHTRCTHGNKKNREIFAYLVRV